MTRIQGDRVTLRSFRGDEFERLMQAAQAAPVGDGIHWGPRDAEPIRKKIDMSGAWHEGWIEFAVEAGGRVVGEVQARCIRRAMPPGVFELGVEIYDHADRGTGLGAAAVLEITTYLFRDEGAIRVQVSTDVDNVGMRTVAERLGFTFEGVQRGFMPTATGPRDYAMYGMTRADHHASADRK
jgi:RimJ/RimL family protein N-acetyltransferase